MKTSSSSQNIIYVYVPYREHHSAKMAYKSKCQRSLVLLLLSIVWSVVLSSQKDNTCSDEEGNIMLCTEKENSKLNKEDPSIQQQCQLYLAPSSIPNAGIGVYTTVPFQKGNRIGENELLIPIVHIPQDDDNYDGWLIDDVRWGVWIDPRLYYEANPEKTQIFLPGLGAAINCNFELNNVEHKTPKLDSAGLHRSQDPGVGAFTYWHDTPNIATRDIQSGEELFIDYGKEWFEARAEAMGVDKSKEPKGTVHPNSKNGGDPSSIRSQEWLKEHGICYDNLYANISTISQAGRGAFAKRFFSKGSVVSPAPVLQLNKEHLFHEPTGKYELLFNYVYGHPDSPILLLPYSSIVNFINHNSQHPNVKLRWSTSPLHRNDFLQLSPEEVFKKRFGLMMEFVALRDIYANEEIFLDYGVEWESAWQKHVNDWLPAPEAEMHMTAEEAMAKMGILTEDEQTTKSYPENVRTACFFNDNEHTFYEDVDDDDNFFKTFKVDKWHSRNDECLRWCTILERRTSNNNEVFYDVLIEPQTAHLLEDCILPDDEIFYVNNVPSNKVTLVDVEYSRDQHLPHAFRHFIRLPDNLYPDTWKQKHSKKMDSWGQSKTSRVEDASLVI